MSTDTTGRAYAKCAEVTDGDVLIADGGFTCLHEGERLLVQSSSDKELFVPCRDGRHYLAGQVEGDHYVGLYPLNPQNTPSAAPPPP